MAKPVKEAVKEGLLGSEDQTAQLSLQTKARFNSRAVKDPETGELYLGPEEFIDAIAPEDEDFVGANWLPLSLAVALCSTPPS
jgi:solute carrier family 25 aspartate/glutamate transporter 12/13